MDEADVSLSDSVADLSTISSCSGEALRDDASVPDSLAVITSASSSWVDDPDSSSSDDV